MAFAPTATRVVTLEIEYVAAPSKSRAPEDSTTDAKIATSQPSSQQSIISLPTEPSLPTTTTPSLPTTPLPTASKRLLPNSHRRNQSHGQINFPKSIIPSNLGFASDSSTHDTYFTSQHAAARCSSVPSTPGITHIHNTNTSSNITAGTEKETYTLADRTSSLVQTTGDVPPSLIGSTTVIHNNQLYLFGGRPPGGDPTNDLYILNLNTLVWTLVDQEQQHRIQTNHNHEDNEEEKRLSPSVDSLSRHDRRGHSPTHLPLTQDFSSEETSKIVDTSLSCSIPQPRYYHSAALVIAPPIIDKNGSITRWGSEDEAHMVVFGGRCIKKSRNSADHNNDSHQEFCLNDTHILDLKTLQWIPSNFNLKTPSTTAAVSQQPSSIDIDSKDEDSGRGSMEPESEGGDPISSTNTVQEPTTSIKEHNPYIYHTPEPRFAHVASITCDRMIIMGGQGPDNEYIHEISVLDLKRYIWMDGGNFQGNASQSRSTLASVVERPMTRRRRRYLECLAAEVPQYKPSSRPLSVVSTSSSPSPFNPICSDIATSSKDSSSLSPASPGDMLSPLLNPRMDSWHRGEGHPFELSIPSIRQRYMSDAELSSTIEQDDYVWVEGEKLDSSDSLSSQELFGLGLEADIPSIAGNSKSPHAQLVMSSNKSVVSTAGSEKSRSRSQYSGLSLSSGKPSPRISPVSNAIPKSFFSKSNGGLFELDGLAATVARDKKLSKVPFGYDKSLRLKRSSSIGANSTSSRRSSGAVDDNMATRRIRRELESEDKNDKRRSLDSVLDNVSVFDPSFAEGRIGIRDLSRTQCTPTPQFQPFYMYSNYISADKRLKRDFMKVQNLKGPYRPESAKVTYEIRPEWTALDLGPGILCGSEGQCPPRMYFPMTHVVDNFFLLSGTLIEGGKEREMTTSSALQTSKPLYSFVSNNQQNPLDVRAPVASVNRQRTFSVWMHNLHNHQWSQLELTKSLRSGTWNRSVLDRDSNFLYILGQTKDSPNKESSEMSLEQSLASESELDSPLAPVSFTHMVKVDLHGLEICPAIDESNIGPAGVNLGLDMLKDGIGADTVIVSSVDGGRILVNSAIVGQRWGFFQDLMEDRDRIRKLEEEARVSQKQEDDASSDPNSPSLLSKKRFLSDSLTEVQVCETTPILVGFLQYIYTNDLVTPHQLKLKTLQGLLLLSHFYDLTRLQQLVREAIYRQLNASNAPAVCEVAVLTNEFGLQTRALRTLLQSARMAQMRRQGEAAEAKRRLEFDMSRLEAIEEDRKRKASMQANQVHLQQVGISAGNFLGAGASNDSSDSITSSPVGSTTTLRQGSNISTNAGSTATVSGLGAIGRFFRQREESVESVGPFV
ncbi:hypothetical protein BGZ49_002655 [Haplosporangium sp. Z 27]|nr:hypothetical protein BGZ49_002655 [Haplosporangium sp. Z 27]